MNKKLITIIIGFLSIFMVGACQQTPVALPPDYSVISSPEIPLIAQATPTELPPTPAPAIEEGPTSDPNNPSAFEMEPAKVLPDISAPTDTPTATPVPTNTPKVEATTAPVVEATSPPPQPSSPPDEPRVGGSWDMEDGFEVWINPFGDECSGSKIAVGWNAFGSRGEYGSACFYLNNYGPNVFSGSYSQQVTFDFVDAHGGIYRTFNSQPGHTYQVTARLRHVHTLPPMQYHFGIDLTGNTNWQAETVQWSPWAEFREDEWITHTATFTAEGENTAIYIKGFHSAASQGGATYIDAIEIVDQG